MQRIDELIAEKDKVESELEVVEGWVDEVKRLLEDAKAQVRSAGVTRHEVSNKFCVPRLMTSPVLSHIPHQSTTHLFEHDDVYNIRTFQRPNVPTYTYSTTSSKWRPVTTVGMCRRSVP